MKIQFIALMLLVANSAACKNNDIEPYNPSNGDNNDKPTEEVVYNQRAKEMFDTMNRDFRFSSTQTSSLYREVVGGQAYSYLWPYVGVLSGAAKLAETGYEIDYRAMVDNLNKYWRANSSSSSMGGFGSSTNGTSGGGTRFYDDNAIAGTELLEACRITGNQDYLARAKQVKDYLLAAVDNTLGEALWWNEDQKNIPSEENSNKPACSNGYAVNFLLRYCQLCDKTEKSEVLNTATKLYNWLYTTLRDPDDNCYWNDLGADGVLNKTKWTYNSGVMIENGVMLYQQTGQSSYLDHAKATATGSYNYFVKTVNGFTFAYPAHDPWFNTKLLKGYVAIVPYMSNAKTYINNYIRFIEKGYADARTSEGLFYEDWTGSSKGRYNELLNQAAVVESYGIIALYKEEKL